MHGAHACCPAPVSSVPQSWLASRGPLLQQMAVQQHLWGEVAAAVQPADSASPLHAGMVESAFASVACATQQAWDGLMQDLLQLYRGKIAQLEAGGWGADSAPPGQGSRPADARPSGSSSGRGGKPDLMLLACSRLRGLVVLCAGGPEARAAARAQIDAADPASAGVPMTKVGLVASWPHPAFHVCSQPRPSVCGAACLPASLPAGLLAAVQCCLLSKREHCACSSATRARLLPAAPTTDAQAARRRWAS